MDEWREPRATTTAQNIQKSAAWGLSMTPAPAASPPHTIGPRAPPVSQTRAAPQAASTRKSARRKSRWPARHAPPER